MSTNKQAYECRQPSFSSPNQDSIDLEYNHPEYGWIPFTASADDIEEHGRDIYEAAMNGEYGPIEPYSGPSETELLEQEMRAQRDGLLNELDAIVSNPLRWAEFDEPTKQALAYRRQALLDVPQQAGFPYDIDWPVNPLGGEGEG